jgi:hypothetical protein
MSRMGEKRGVGGVMNGRASGDIVLGLAQGSMTEKVGRGGERWRRGVLRAVVGDEMGLEWRR